MPLGPEAYYADQNSDDPELRAGVNLPRCKAKPGKDETMDLRRGDLSRGKWECALPAGHEEFNNPRHQPHSWTEVT